MGGRSSLAGISVMVRPIGEPRLLPGIVVPRVSDLDALASSTTGKVEIEAMEEDRGEQIVEHLLRSATLGVFRDHLTIDDLRGVLTAFDEGRIAQAGEDVGSSDLVALLDEVPALAEPVRRLTGGDESPAMVASAVELILEGLHLSKRLNKDAVGARATYRGR